MKESKYRQKMNAKDDVKTALGANSDNGFQNKHGYKEYKKAVEFKKYCNYIDEDNSDVNGITNDLRYVKKIVKKNKFNGKSNEHNIN